MLSAPPSWQRYLRLVVAAIALFASGIPATALAAAPRAAVVSGSAKEAEVVLARRARTATVVAALMPTPQRFEADGGARFAARGTDPPRPRRRYLLNRSLLR